MEKAFPAIVTKTQFRKVNKQMSSRAPRKTHPRRVGSSYLLSGLVKCKACERSMSGQDSKGGKFAYYVCQSLMKRGSGACDCPRLNARRFEEMVVGKIRENVLTESNIRELVKLVDEEMDGIAKEQRQRLETAEAELADVKRRLERLYNLAETTDLDIEDFKPRIKDHRERQERLEATAAEARVMLSQRRVVLDDVETITAYAHDLSEFLNESELTERRAFIESFVKEVVVQPGGALVRYTIPMPEDSPIGGRDAEEMALHSPVLSTVKSGGPCGDRTHDTRIKSPVLCLAELTARSKRGRHRPLVHIVALPPFLRRISPSLHQGNRILNLDAYWHPSIPGCIRQTNKDSALNHAKNLSNRCCYVPSCGQTLSAKLECVCPEVCTRTNAKSPKCSGR